MINHNREWNIRNKLDINLMKKGAKKFIGTHDFSTFRAANCSAKNPIRTIKKIQILKSKKQIKIRINSQSFLKSQVRSMVGSLKYLSEKKWDLKKFENILKSKDRKNCAPLAPAHGLYLEKVMY
jgi:tRNA pseudouridine38-40 synthase